MLRTVFGCETEYALSFRNADTNDTTEALQKAADDIVHRAAARLPHLQGNKSAGVFLANGGRLYVDRYHLEYSTPEVNNPADLVRCYLAGDHFLARAAKAQKALLFKNNVDYNGPVAYGSHESYYFRNLDFKTLASNLQPHLASRVICTGSGGFNPLLPGLVFTLSPVCHCIRLSDGNRYPKSLVDTNDEPLSANGHRLHLPCGDSCRSQRTIYLRFGVTAALVCLLDAGIPVADRIRLKDPLKAIQIYAYDPTLTATAESMDGPPLSAMEIQWYYLNMIEFHLDRLPSWAADVARVFRETLLALEQGYKNMSASLEWAIRYALYSEYLQRNGHRWDIIASTNEILEALVNCHNAEFRSTSCARPHGIDTPSESAYPLDLTALLTSYPVQVDILLKNHNVSRHQLDTSLRLRRELLEIDTRFNLLAPGGIFSMLDHQGLLNHHAPGVHDIEKAILSPPAGRAAVRGWWIRHLAQAQRNATCEWDSVWDADRDKWLDLGDAFGETKASWSTIISKSQADCANQTYTRFFSLYRRGDLKNAMALLESIEPQKRDNAIRRYYAWMRARLGHLDALDIIKRLYEGSEQSIMNIGDHLLVLRFNYLIPNVKEMEPWVARGRESLTESNETAGQAIMILEYSAYCLLAKGLWAEAMALFVQAHENEIQGMNDDRIISRLLCGRAESLRRLGRHEEAMQLLAQAEPMHSGIFEGDFVNYNLTCRAKLAEIDPMRAERLLARIGAVQRCYGDRMGLVRTMMLEAKLCRSQRKKTTRRKDLVNIRDRIPVLTVDPTYERIVSRWDEWTRGNQPDGYGDPFWGL